MEFPKGFFEDEVREGFYVPSMMKRCWAAQLEVLEMIDTICKKHGLKWFADYGTLLGAVRHKGFIPWDDDMDISMMRTDLEKFLEVAKDELPEGMVINDPRYRKEWGEILVRICNTEVARADDEFRMKYHGFPVHAGIDIFPMDVLPDDEKKAFSTALQVVELMKLKALLENSPREMWDDLLSDFEKKSGKNGCSIKIPRDENTISFIALRVIEYSSKYKNLNSKRVAKIWGVGIWDYIFERMSIETLTYLDFEHTKMPCPIGYNGLLTNIYGQNYMVPYRATEEHTYPYFHKLIDDAIYDPPFYYSFDQHCKELCRTVRGNDFASYILERVDLIKKINGVVSQIANSETLAEQIMNLLSKGQELAIQIGTVIEIRYKSSKREDLDWAQQCVGILERYCEAVFSVHIGVTETGDVSAISELEKLVSEFETLFGSRKKYRRLLMIMPWKASGWCNVEEIYSFAVNSGEWEVQVVPIPYYLKEWDGNTGELVNESSLLPEEIEISSYEDINYDGVRPDMIITQNPYDNYNHGSGLPPFFFTSELRSFTDCLVYVPWFETEEISLSDFKAQAIMRYYVTVPGLLNCDYAVVSSEKTKETYEKILDEFTNGDKSCRAKIVTDICNLLG